MGLFDTFNLFYAPDEAGARELGAETAREFPNVDGIEYEMTSGGDYAVCVNGMVSHALFYAIVRWGRLSHPECMAFPR